VVIATGTVVLKELPREEARVNTVVEPMSVIFVSAFAVLKAYLITYLTGYLTKIRTYGQERKRASPNVQRLNSQCRMRNLDVPIGQSEFSRKLEQRRASVAL